jgi:sugar/nucleoside kinase (ribokinase family)
MSTDVVVAGHACVDLIPELTGPIQLEPGRLSEVGPVTFAPGGAVPNVGLALATLGTAPKLVGRIGDDALGEVLLGLVRRRLRAGTLAFERVPGESTSYTIIISPPGVDRLFLHHPGCNDRFNPRAVDSSTFADARLFYFGYPPAMRSTYEDGGTALAGLFQRAKARGVTTALDMSMPDPASQAGRQDWTAFLRRVLPNVDVFLPSWEEVLFMLDPERFTARAAPTPALLLELSEFLLGLGSGMVGIKLGRNGMYLRTADVARVHALGRAAPSDPKPWARRELWAPVFVVPVAGTTGAGDATVAGFLAALLRDLAPEEVLRMGVAVGAHCVEAPDATSGLRSWDETESRVRGGWLQHSHAPPDTTWNRHDPTGILCGPHDQILTPSLA